MGGVLSSYATEENTILTNTITDDNININNKIDDNSNTDIDKFRTEEIKKISTEEIIKITNESIHKMIDSLTSEPKVEGYYNELYSDDSDWDNDDVESMQKDDKSMQKDTVIDVSPSSSCSAYSSDYSDDSEEEFVRSERNRMMQHDQDTIADKKDSNDIIDDLEEKVEKYIEEKVETYVEEKIEEFIEKKFHPKSTQTCNMCSDDSDDDHHNIINKVNKSAKNVQIDHKLLTQLFDRLDASIQKSKKKN